MHLTPPWGMVEVTYGTNSSLWSKNILVKQDVLSTEQVKIVLE